MHAHELRPFRLVHLGQSALVGTISRPVERLYELYPGWSAFCGGQFVGAGGMLTPYPGLGECWAVLTPLVPDGHLVWFHRSVKRGILSVSKALNLRRIQCTVSADHGAALKWAERLGFQREALLRRFGPAGEDTYMMAMFPEVR